jgi:GNAT superfamily N-acetyltransferase
MKIQELKLKDINSLEDLQPAGWEGIKPFFDFYVKSDFCFPVKIAIDNKIVGIGSTIVHGDIGWLAHIIVQQDYRNKGIGQLITQTLINSLGTMKCQTIYLIATDLGAPLYKKNGFKTETDYLFFKDLHFPNRAIPENIELCTKDMVDRIAYLDKKVSGENRMPHIKGFIDNAYVFSVLFIIFVYYLAKV